MFRTEEELARADFDLLRDGSVSLFWRREYFQAAQEALQALGYRLMAVSADRDSLFTELSAALRWRDLFGYEPWTGSLDALDDAFFAPDFPAGEDVAICFEGFHRLAAQDAAYAQGLLDVIARGSRTQLLHGRRIIVLVQTDDPQFCTDPLGGVVAQWNSREWFNKDRGIDSVT